MGKSTTGSAKWLFLACKARTGDPMAKLVLIALADRANDKGVCWPAYERLAEDCECSKRTVMRALQKLEELGLVERISRFAKGMQQSNQYRITIGVTDCHSGVSESHPGGDTESPKPPNETPIVFIEPDEAFERFWKAYPRKTDKSKGKKAFHKHVKDEQTLGVILANIEARLGAGDWRRDRARFIPHPTTYLNNKRWEDEVIPDENPGNGDGPGKDTRRLSAVERVREQRRKAGQRCP